MWPELCPPSWSQLAPGPWHSQILQPSELLSVLITTSPFLPQGPCSHHCLCLVHSSSISLNNWLLPIIQISDQMLLSEKGFHWPPSNFFFLQGVYFHVALFYFLHNSWHNLEVVLIIYGLLICLPHAPPVESKFHEIEACVSCSLLCPQCWAQIFVDEWWLE